VAGQRGSTSKQLRVREAAEVNLGSVGRCALKPCDGVRL